MKGDYLDFDDVIGKFEKMMDWLAGVYVNAMNIIHYMHDKYAYERIEMALHDYAPLRTMAFGMAGMSVVADSLSAIKYAKVRVVRDETGLVTDYQTEGEFPLFGNNDNRVDQLAAWVVSTFMNKLRKYPDLSQRPPHAVDSDHHLECRLRQGDRQHAGRPPAGRAVRPRRESDARPRQPRHPRRGRIGRQDSLSRRRRRHLAHGDHGAGRSRAESPEDRITNLTGMLDAFFSSTGYHMNVNVLNRDTLLDAMDHPEKYPHLTIRVSGYAVNFVRLTREQQMDVINRTFHGDATMPEQRRTVSRLRSRPRARLSSGSTSARTFRNRTSGPRSPPATWDSFIRSPPARPWTARAFASSRGRPAACGAVTTATTRTPGP